MGNHKRNGPPMNKKPCSPALRSMAPASGRISSKIPNLPAFSLTVPISILRFLFFHPFLFNLCHEGLFLRDKKGKSSVNTAAEGGSKEEAKDVTIKTTEPATPAGTQNASVATPLRQCASSDAVTDDPSHNVQEVKQAPQYDAMIFEALSTSSDSNGSDLNAIVSFIEQKQEVPQNYRRAVGARLRKLVAQGKLEKVQNCYRIKTPVESIPPAPEQIDSSPRQSLPSGSTASHESLTHAEKIAELVADLDHKSRLADEAVKEAERVAELAEENDVLLQIFEEILERCSRGEIVYLK
ncbi:hypothetical protein K1719_009249 [Acacia pycnantha]|nr:hypothetical protein K1719_009249 [Acacia pycnantha]